MDSKKLGIVTLATFSLLVGVAQADRKLELSGGFKHDTLATAELKVLKEKGDIVAIKGIKFKQVFVHCRGGDQRAKLRPRGKLATNSEGRFERAYTGDNSGQLELRGHVVDNGKKAKGHIRTTEPIAINGRDCKVFDKKFIVKR